MRKIDKVILLLLAILAVSSIASYVHQDRINKINVLDKLYQRAWNNDQEDYTTNLTKLVTKFLHNSY